ncbi:hypothetical protein MMC30_003788 [Trapelia coarctata]|nr:hypothetical protein [Trapelia coarctata]
MACTHSSSAESHSLTSWLQATVNKTVQRFGLTEVYAPTPANSALVDVVFVHGLNGDPHNTWTSSPSGVFWPADLLPQFIEDVKARVLVYGYDADVASLAGSGTTKDKIHNHAERLVADLFANRRIRKATERPIIFVAHSLGGLVVKRALLSSNAISGVRTEHLRSICVSTYGILFLGTPHKGADLASWGSFLEWLCKAVPKKALDTSPQLIDALKTNSETLQNIDRDFAQIMSRFHLFFFHEAKPTDMKGTLRFIVEEDSAAPTLPDIERAGIQADHSHMCKFENESAPGFDLVVDGIQRYAEEAPRTIEKRWNFERSDRNDRRSHIIEELGGGEFPAERFRRLKLISSGSHTIMQTPPSDTTSEFGRTPVSSIHDLRDSNLLSKPESPSLKADAQTSTTPDEPYFIVPPAFRTNTFFVGMQKELVQLDRKLFDKKRRAAGTACVLLHGQAGVGKSHLARQYVFKNREKFPGGVFWINSRLIEEVEKDFWHIAQKVVAADSPGLRTSGDDNGGSFVEVVKSWFEARHEWLIVLDGVTMESDKDIDELQRFIPNSRDSSLIYVSRAKRLEIFQRLLLPQAVKVAPLSDDDARKLLLKSIPIHHPREAQIKSATDLVKKVGGLPLAITAISHRIAYTHEPLEKYTIKSYADDQKIGARYHEIMDDLQKRGHMEAFNLISVLCFYGPHIPVEMIHLGLKSLRHNNVEVKSSENGEKPDINSTFGILMRYGLLERNEPDDRESMSSSRSTILDTEPIDMLKMHTVVQKFCCDRLNASKLLRTWLTNAIRLFCYSFAEADRRIKQRPEQGRVSDYREYLVHGNRLHSHTFEYESKSQLLGSLRTELEPTLLLIKEEIRSREPSSSQGSVDRADFQVSVFDRTSNSSSSGISEPGVKTPNSRPTPLPLDMNPYGMPLREPSTDSPRSIGTNSPKYEPRIIDHSPHARFPPFYENDNLGSQAMEKSASDSTTRPRATSNTSQGLPWELVQSTRRVKRLDYTGRSFQRSPARAELTRNNATGSVVREAQGKLSGSSDAFSMLEKVHRQSPPPPPSRGSIWSRSSSERSGAPVSARPTYAGVVAGHTQLSNNRPYSSPLSPPMPSEQNMTPGSTGFERGRSRESQSRRPPNLQAEQSPHNSQTLMPSTGSIRQPSLPRATPKLMESSVLPPNPQYVVTAPVPNSSFHPYHGALRNPDTLPRYTPPNVTGPNPLPLPHENITVTSRFPGPIRSPYRDFASQSTASPPGTIPDLSNYQYDSLSNPNYLPISQPTGYYSQPVSREHSHQSHGSGTATEPTPAHRSGISPHLNSILMENSAPRPRNADGSPKRKSPKIGYSQPTLSPLGKQESPDLNLMSSSDSALLSGTGGWAVNSLAQNASTPRYMHFSSTHSDHSPTASQHNAMARGESNGPGIWDGEGVTQFGHDGHVVFGELEPTSIAEARRRIRAYDEFIRRREGGGGRGRRDGGDGGGMFEEGDGAMAMMLDERGLEVMGEEIFERGAQGEMGLGLVGGYGGEGGPPYPEINRILTR